MNILTKSGIALLIGASAFNASALTFEFDPEQDSTFIDVDTLTTNMFPNDPVVVSQFFGADRKLNNGDKFSESFSYNSTSATGSPDHFYGPPQFNTAITFDLTLTGTIHSVVYGAGIPDLADYDAGNFPTFFDNLKQTGFGTAFNTTANDASVGMTIKYEGTTIGMFDMFAQVTTPAISLDGSSQTAAFVFDFRFNQTWAAANTATINNVWRRDGGGFVDVANFTIQGKGSAGPDGTLVDNGKGGVYTVQNGEVAPGGDEYVGINVADNGASFINTVPEPTTLAILGLGLLGFAGTRRRS